MENLKYDIHQLILDDAYVHEGTLSGNTIELTMAGVLAETGKELLVFDRIRLVMTGFSLVTAESLTRRALAVNNTVKQIKGRRLYKSEMPDFTARLTGEEWDIVSFDFSDERTAAITLCFSDGGLFSFTARCSKIYACTDSVGRKISGGNGRSRY